MKRGSITGENGMKLMFWLIILYISTGHVICNFSWTALIVLAVIYAVWLLDTLLSFLKKRKVRRYSRFGNQFGSSFGDSSGGIFYGDGFRGINNNFGGGFK